MNAFETLNAINVNDHTEQKNGLTYLSWAWAWAEVMKKYPDAQYTIMKWEGGKPYTYDPLTGYMVYTTVTIEGITREMWLPVMDGQNKAMMAEPYTYKTKQGERTVEAATMFDINKTIMRCLTKNLAMFGLGLYIYAGEDLPEGGFANKEVTDLKYRSWFDTYFTQYPERREGFMAKQGIKNLDDLDKVKSLDEIDSIMTTLKTLMKKEQTL